MPKFTAVILDSDNKEIGHDPVLHYLCMDASSIFTATVALKNVVYATYPKLNVSMSVEKKGEDETVVKFHLNDLGNKFDTVTYGIYPMEESI